MKEFGKHPSGNITGRNWIFFLIIFFYLGISCIDFIILPARARLSMIYDGEISAEGFLSLKRLWLNLILYKNW